ncbi:Fe-S cluster assembly protein SufD [Prochlorococcus marinus]|uniref:ABC transporter, membrane component n=1 Tax=Prochlorococcus marinus (strain MIT 9211) TaxID=93059 RepID=A9B9D3_PROM4|nr:Fe-S cluster assembly protein SufD [Prochlorococcus marinus]ABX08010.1 ABC transporter, membrane component [Prochlorococcus marinus str. MIT 9211]
MSELLKNWIQSLPAASGDLRRIQESGRKYLGEIGIPNNKLEEWKLIDTKKINNILSLPMSKRIEPKDIDQTIPQLAKNSFRIIINSNISKLDEASLPKGMSLMMGDELQRYLKKADEHIDPSHDWILSLNHSSNNQLIALRISESNSTGLELVIPKNINQLSFSRVLIIVEKGANLNLLEIILGANKSAHSHVCEIHLDNNSKVHHGLIAMGREDSSLFAGISIFQKSDSNYFFNSFQEGWDLSHLKPTIIQLEGSALTDLQGLQVAKDSQQLSTHSAVKFDGPGGTLRQLQKAIALDKSHSIFNGLIEVPKLAQKTNASQLSKNLLLSNRAQIDTKPELKIIADDVSCTHGATISNLQEDELFYLQSRGLSAENAAALIVNGYAKEIIRNIPLEVMRWSFLNEFLSE